MVILWFYCYPYYFCFNLLFSFGDIFRSFIGEFSIVKKLLHFSFHFMSQLSYLPNRPITLFFIIRMKRYYGQLLLYYVLRGIMAYTLKWWFLKLNYVAPLFYKTSLVIVISKPSFIIVFHHVISLEIPSTNGFCWHNLMCLCLEDAIAYQPSGMFFGVTVC